MRVKYKIVSASETKENGKIQRELFNQWEHLSRGVFLHEKNQSKEERR